MIPNIAGPVLLLRRILCIRPWWHANGIGWVVWADGEPVEFLRTLSDALQAARALE
jgi:hypothetical protein